MRKENYEILIEKHPLPMMVLDAVNGDILHVNEACLDFYGYTYSEFMLMNISDINTYTEEEIKQEIIASATQVRNYFVFVHKLKSGETKKVDVISYPIDLPRKKVLLTLVNEHVSKDNVSKTFLDIVHEVDDPVCLIKKNVDGIESIYATSRAFNDLIAYDSETYPSNNLKDFIHIKGEHSLDDPIMEAEIKNLKLDKFIPADVLSTKLRYQGDTFYLLTVNPKNLKSNDRDILDINDLDYEDLIGKKGYLVNITVFLNINSERRFNSIKDYINRFVIQQSMFHVIKVHEVKNASNLLYFVEADMAKVYSFFNLILNEKFEYNRSTDEDNNLRISISKYGEIDEEQVRTLNELLNSYDKYEFNVIHTYTHRRGYYRALELKEGMVNGLENNEFILYSQAMINVSTNQVEGYEILVRWMHPKYGLVMPDEFIPYAELTGIIKKIDFYVIKKTFEFLKENQVQLDDPIIHINLSTRTLSNREFVPFVIGESQGIKTDNIVFEITEGKAISSIDFSVQELKRLGFQLAIDDFGKGYSSFERIKNIGIQYVKIDKSFIEGLTENVNDILILKAIISMCNNLNIKVIAEGIETEEQLEFLYSRKCYIIQGFIFSRPSDINNMITQRTTLDDHIHVTTNRLLSSEISSKKFYNSGRIIMQDIDSDYALITPNVALADTLDYEFEDFVELSFLDLVPVAYKNTFTKFVESLKEDTDLDAIMIQLNNKFDKATKVICAINKKIAIDHYRLYIEFMDSNNDKEMELLGLSHSYLQAFDEAPSGMIIVNDNFSIKRWNVSCESIFGYSHIEAKNKNIIKLLTDDYQEVTMNKLFNKSVKTGKSEMVLNNTTIENKKIICRWHISAVYDELEQSYQYICIVNDITESIKSSRELSKVNKALEQSNSIILMTNVRGQIEYTNKKFSEVTGYSSEEVLGRSPGILSSHEHDVTYYKNMWNTILKGGTWEGEFHNVKKDGQLYWADSKIYPILEEGEITGFLEIQTDKTQEKELVSLNNNLKNKLFEQDKVASLGLLSSGIMHEINNPLSYIQGNVKYLLELLDELQVIKDDDFEDLKDAIVDIDKGVTQIKEIADGLKKYIFNASTEDKDVVDLIDELETVVMLSKNEYKYYANVNLIYDSELDYKVSGYGSKLKQVFMNLIINASHAIAASNKEVLGNINIELQQSKNDVIITFVDDGCGMDAATVEKIYEPLFTTKEEGVGSGLGLSVSRQIIENDHNGVIICTSQVGLGTTFRIKLPKGE